MIDRDGTWIEMACDECGELSGDAFDRDEFAAMTTAARAAGWKIEPYRGGWRHVCAFCQTPPPLLDDAFDEESPRRYAPDIEALLGPCKDYDL